MGNAFNDGCGDDYDDASCPICRGEELSPEFIAMINAAEPQSGQVMTGDEFNAWLDDQAASAL